MRASNITSLMRDYSLQYSIDSKYISTIYQPSQGLVLLHVCVQHIKAPFQFSTKQEFLNRKSGLETDGYSDVRSSPR